MAVNNIAAFNALPSNLRRTAFHEAGHAVLQHVLNIGPESVTIIPSYDENEAGHTVHSGEGRQAQAEGEADDGIAMLRMYAGESFHLRHAIACYAGAEAQRRLDPTRNDWRAGTEDDYRQAAYHIDDVTDDEQSVDLLFKLAQRRCQMLVEHYWPEINAIVGLLRRERTITGEQVRVAFCESLKARGGNGRLRW